MDENKNIVGTENTTEVTTNESTTVETKTDDTANSKAACDIQMTQDDFDKAIQSAEDKIRTKYSKEVKQLQDKISTLSPVEKSKGEIEFENRLAELETKQAEVTEKEKVLNLKSALQAKNIDGGIADYLKADINIEKFTSLINSLVDSRIKATGYQPSNHANNSGMTKEKWSKLSYSEKAKFTETNPELAKSLMKK